MMSVLRLALAALLLAGCTTVSAVAPMGGGRYSVTSDSHTLGPNGVGATRTQALQKANAFCAAKHKQLDVEKIQSQMGINTYAASLIFRCR